MTETEQPNQPLDEFEQTPPMQENDEPTSEVQGFFENKKNRYIIALAGVALAVISAVGIGSRVGASNKETRTTVDTTGSIIPSNTAETTTTSITVTPEKSVEDYQAAIEKDKQMRVSQFELLPRDERLRYSQYLIDQTVKFSIYDASYGNNGTGKGYGIEPVTASIDNGGQEILDGMLYAFQMSYIQQVDRQTQIFDKSNARKLLSAVYYNVGKSDVSEFYTKTVNLQKKLTDPLNSSEHFEELQTSDLTTGKNKSGEEVQYRIINYGGENNKTYYSRFIYTLSQIMTARKRACG